MIMHMTFTMHAVRYVLMYKFCVSGRALSGNVVWHHDVLLGWNSTLYHVPDDDQQNNRQVGDAKVTSHNVCIK